MLSSYTVLKHPIVCACYAAAGVAYTGESALAAVKTSGEVLAEVTDQLALVDLGTLSAGFGCSLAQGMYVISQYHAILSDLCR